MHTRRALPPQVLLVVTRAPIVLKPVDEHLEGLMVDFMEVEAFRAHFDKLLQNFIFGDVTEDNVLWVSW